jgi:ADP-dependent NAD(P)H-hydrate dehydratase / NAD(P)H-hydrate epimerase
MRVVSVEEMREIERRAETEYGLTSPMLMERAGQSVAEILRSHAGGDVRDLDVLVLVGPGNNGGDGRVMGRYLAGWGARVSYFLWKENALERNGQTVPAGDPLENVREALASADIVVDALLGTGHARPLAPTMRQALALVQAESDRRPGGLVVLAVDLPSGLNADTGAVDEGTIAAGLTVTLAFPKTGLYFFPGAALVGELEVGSIGLPDEMDIPRGMEALDAPLIRPSLPARPLESNKGTYGKAMILAGSPPYVGAAFLAASAAGRIGAGLITIATTPELSHVYASSLVEATYCLLPSLDAKPEERARVLLDALRGYRALIVGPGLGQSDVTREFLLCVFDGVRALPKSERPQMIVDADGLNNLSRVERWHERLPAETVLTPHPGEMARLRGGARVSGGGVDRLAVASECAHAWGHVVVLKGAATLVASPDGALRLNWPGNPALATAGTGDVLAGTIGGLLAQGMSPFEAASAGVYLHSRAGLLVSARLGDAGLLASDLLLELPLALRATKDS